MKCARCNRPLKNPTSNGYGPKCATAVLGARPARSRHTSRRPAGKDERQVELFSVVQP
nr:MAG TPA: zinc-ribbon containing domain protein [Caudoviricetes sp.]